MENKNLFQLVKTNATESERIDAPNYSYWKSVFRSFFSKPTNYVAIGLLLVVLFLSFVQPILSGYTMDMPNINNPDMQFLPPSAEFLFGTDQVGDSLFDVVWAGARTSLLLALICSVINITIGVAVGAWWGYSKAVDKVMTEVYNIISNVPFILFIMVFMYIAGAGFWQLVAAMTITGWIGIAYFIRTQVIIIRDREYNLASKCLGTPVIRMISRNILPYLTSVIVTLASREIPSYISYEVFLSYIGVGIGNSQQSLGRIIQTYSVWMDQKPYVFWIPVAVAALVTVTLYIVGQNLADSSDPKTHM
jgi:oligopeptide transport system permease protein